MNIIWIASGHVSETVFVMVFCLLWGCVCHVDTRKSSCKLFILQTCWACNAVALSSTVCSKRTRKAGCTILIAHISAREPGSRYQKFQADFVRKIISDRFTGWRSVIWMKLPLVHITIASGPKSENRLVALIFCAAKMRRSTNHYCDRRRQRFSFYAWEKQLLGITYMRPCQGKLASK